MPMTQLRTTDAESAWRAGGDADALILVGPAPRSTGIGPVDRCLSEARAVDAGLDGEVSLLPLAEVAGGRLVLAPTGSLDRDGDDVRRFGEATRRGVVRAARAGARRPLLVVSGGGGSPFARAVEVSVLEGLGAGWAPLEARDVLGAGVEPISALTLWTRGTAGSEEGALGYLSALEAGRRVARDVTGTEPERMSPPGMAAYCRRAFDGAAVELEVVEAREALEREYPLLCAVARASWAVPRHHPRVLRLRYRPEGVVQRTLLIAGKGVVYDTGGADVKYGGAMAGMSRDKGGAGAVLGFMAAVERLRPVGVEVVAEVGAVRNSIGSDGFVTDEIVTGHAGVRVRIGNTDAEGRLVLADLLSHLREEAERVPDPRLCSVATLTGHVGRAYGPYTAAIDNAAARRLGLAEQLARDGEAWGEPVELSRLRREDFDFVRPRSAADDVLSSNPAPSTQTARGHQFPAAFMQVASGLSRTLLPFTHVDIGGSAVENGDWQHGRPTGAPVVAMLAAAGLLPM